jgi:glucokinase
MTDLIVAIDLGGTQIRAALARTDGTILARSKTLTAPEEGRDAVIERIVQAAQAVMAHSTQRPRGVGVGSPGPLDPWTGVVLGAPNLGWYNVPLKDLLEKRLGLPVIVGNDCNAAALGERRFGAGKECDDLVYMTVSTGIGGGIISAGKLLLGTHGFGGEIGHVTVEANGLKCKCGNIGCLEAYAAGPAIAREAQERLQKGESSLIPSLVNADLEQVTAAVVGRAAQAGDALAQSVIERAAFYIGVGLVGLVHMVEPQLILIGGGVANTGDILFDTIRRTVQERAMSCMAEGLRIEPASLGDDVGLMGAIALFLEYADV